MRHATFVLRLTQLLSAGFVLIHAESESDLSSLLLYNDQTNTSETHAGMLQSKGTRKRRVHAGTKYKLSLIHI